MTRPGARYSGNRSGFGPKSRALWRDILPHELPQPIDRPQTRISLIGSEPADKRRVIHGLAAKRCFGHPSMSQEGLDLSYNLFAQIHHHALIIVGPRQRRKRNRCVRQATMHRVVKKNVGLRQITVALLAISNYRYCHQRRGASPIAQMTSRHLHRMDPRPEVARR